MNNQKIINLILLIFFQLNDLLTILLMLLSMLY